MGKVAQNSVKYVIEAKLKSSGIVEKPDIVGAIFGQTEGLLNEDLDLRELQERGRIGRIDVETRRENGSSRATIKIPSSLDATDTALIAASLETIERVGPTNADIRIDEIRDERVSKRDYIVKRAKQLLQDLDSQSPSHERITEEVKRELRTHEATELHGFEAGPEAENADEIILVEGRADLMNLLKYGVKNALALGGTSVPENVSRAVEGKDITAFLDGDRGGDLILEELKEKAEPRYVARAPENKEVEELGKEQVYEALRDKEPVEYAQTREVEEEDSSGELEELHEELRELVGTRALHVLDEDFNTEEKMPLDQAGKKLNRVDSCYAIAFDGEIDNDLVEKAEALGAKYIAGMKKTGSANSSELELVTREELAARHS